MMKTKRLIAALALLGSLHAVAGPGHDHGDEAPAAPGVALPRFAASSELFELVGVLEGKTLRLYLDRAATNEPLPQAGLELEFGGAKLVPKAQPDGSFVVELPAPPGEGHHAVTATVTVGDETDLLAGELDLHGQAHEHAESATSWRRWSLWAGGTLLGLAAGAAVLVGLRRRREQALVGGVA